MGANNSKKTTGKHIGVSDEEQRQLQKMFHVASKESLHVSEITLQELWSGVDSYIVRMLLKYYFSSRKLIDFEIFIKPYISVVRSTVDEKVDVLQTSLSNEEGISTKEIMEYVHSIVHSFLLNLQNDKEFISWKNAGCSLVDDRIDLLSNFLCQDVPRSPFISSEQFTAWIYTWSTLQAMERAVFRNIFGVTIEDASSEISLPQCIGINNQESSPSILDLTDILFLNTRLPKELRSEWRFLFSTNVHGESFSKLLGKICNQGASLIIVQDKFGCVFGGFAPDSWRVGPTFIGNASSFLFKLKPNLSTYHPTCYNDHYQYLNIQQQTLPNGLGMGGQFEYFGLWLDADFGKGHSSESCTTYRGYQMLSGAKNFEINHIEVWGVGPIPAVDEDEEGRSVLDDPKHLEAKAMMEMVGKTQHSEGVREPED